MGHDLALDSWLELDSWWAALGSRQQLSESDLRTLGFEWGSDEWSALDGWWNAYANCHLSSWAAGDARKLTQATEIDQRETLDDWWQSYVDLYETNIRELEASLDELNECWTESACRFDQDPLVAGWNAQNTQAGPLRPNQEENWSQWLAHLLRSSAGEFSSELFGSPFDRSPESVRREVYFTDTNRSDRRIDILVEYPGQGISIEVKKGDEHYEKTFHTAGLIEARSVQEWQHYLLLPKRKQSALRSSFTERLREPSDAGPYIESDVSNDISVIYWEDVSRALRRTLLQSGTSTPHWDASAYLFVTLIEQQLLDFSPLPAIEEDCDSEEPNVPDIQVLESIEIDEQHDYLERVIEDVNR